MLYQCIPDGVAVQGKTLSGLQRTGGARVGVPVQIDASQITDMQSDTVMWHDKNDGETGCEIKSGLIIAQHHKEYSEGEMDSISMQDHQQPTDLGDNQIANNQGETEEKSG